MNNIIVNNSEPETLWNVPPLFNHEPVLTVEPYLNHFKQYWTMNYIEPSTILEYRTIHWSIH